MVKRITAEREGKIQKEKKKLRRGLRNKHTLFKSKAHLANITLQAEISKTKKKKHESNLKKNKFACENMCLLMLICVTQGYSCVIQ